jgi:hypothetical protein
MEASMIEHTSEEARVRLKRVEEDLRWLDDHPLDFVPRLDIEVRVGISQARMRIDRAVAAVAEGDRFVASLEARVDGDT